MDDHDDPHQAQDPPAEGEASRAAPITWGLYCAHGAIYTLKLAATPRFWLKFTVMSAFVVILVICRLYFPGTMFYGAVISTWCLYIVICIILSPVCSLITWVALIATEMSFGRIKIYKMKLHYLRMARPRLSYLLWSIGILVSWQSVFQNDPFTPAGESLSSDLWWVARFMWVNLAFSLLTIGKAVLLRYVALGKRLEIYFKPVEETMLVETVLSALTASVPPRVFTLTRLDTSLLPRSHINQGEAAIRIQAFFRKVVGRHGTPSLRSDRSTQPSPTHDISPTAPRTDSADWHSPPPEHDVGHVAVDVDDAIDDHMKNVQQQPQTAQNASDSSTSPPLSSPDTRGLPSDPDHRSSLRNRSARKSTADFTEAPPEKARVPLARTASVRDSRGNGDRPLSPLEPEEDAFVRSSEVLKHANRAEHVKNNMMRVCAGLRPLKTRSDARRLGEVIFGMFSDPNTGKLAVGSLRRGLPSWKMFSHAKAMFDPYSQHELSLASVVASCVKFYNERKNLGRSLRNLDSIVDALSSFLNGAIAVILFFVSVIAFSTGQYAELSVWLGSSVFALSFIFQASAQNAFQSFMFLFGRHPFDVGDRVIVHGEGKDELCSDNSLLVHRMELLTTTFKTATGAITTIPNFVLLDKRITSFTRSGSMTDQLNLYLNRETSAAALERFKLDFFSYVGSHASIFDSAECSFKVQDLKDPSGRLCLAVQLDCAYRTNWQAGIDEEQRGPLLEHLNQSMLQHGIGLELPIQPTVVSGPLVDTFNRLVAQESSA
eukprot:m.15114 g.15114  ORF g.15114 m.15114 type:complete len:773 (+) comp2999_c0_seq1:62-2380(+)